MEAVLESYRPGTSHVVTTCSLRNQTKHRLKQYPAKHECLPNIHGAWECFMQVQEGHQCAEHRFKHVDEGHTRRVDVALQAGSEEQWQQDDDQSIIEQGKQVPGLRMQRMPVSKEQEDNQRSCCQGQQLDPQHRPEARWPVGLIAYEQAVKEEDIAGIGHTPKESQQRASP